MYKVTWQYKDHDTAAPLVQTVASIDALKVLLDAIIDPARQLVSLSVVRKR